MHLNLTWWKSMLKINTKHSFYVFWLVSTFRQPYWELSSISWYSTYSVVVSSSWKLTFQQTRRTSFKMKLDKCKIVLKATYWFLFVVLVCVSYIFIDEAWQDYVSGRTDMTHEIQPITKHPVVTVTFLEQYRQYLIDWDNLLHGQKDSQGNLSIIANRVVLGAFHWERFSIEYSQTKVIRHISENRKPIFTKDIQVGYCTNETLRLLSFETWSQFLSPAA